MKMGPQKCARPILWTRLKRDLKQSQRDRIFEQYEVDQAFVETPDGVRIEILEDKTQSMPIRNEHVHLSLTETEISKAQAWYAKTFGGKPGSRNNAPVVDIP